MSSHCLQSSSGGEDPSSEFSTEDALRRAPKVPSTLPPGASFQGQPTRLPKISFAKEILRSSGGEEFFSARSDIPVSVPDPSGVLVHEKPMLTAKRLAWDMIDSAQSCDTAMATLQYKFRTFPNSGEEFPYSFSLDYPPMDWSPKSVHYAPDRDSISELLQDITTTSNGAAYLLSMIILSTFIWTNSDYISTQQFYKIVQSEAHQLLFSFRGAPAQYLIKLDNFKLLNKGVLSDLEFSDGIAFFVLDRKGNLTWLSNVAGRRIKRKVIGELPVFHISFL